MTKAVAPATNTEALSTDTYFNGNNCGAANCFLKVDFGASLDIKAVLVVGIPGRAESVNWTMRLGDSSDSAMNTLFFTAGTDIDMDWAKEILVDSRGRYMEIIKTISGDLWLGYIAVFIKCYLNCSGSTLFD
jgi:hypothetical protein